MGRNKLGKLISIQLSELLNDTECTLRKRTFDVIQLNQRELVEETETMPRVLITISWHCKKHKNDLCLEKSGKQQEKVFSYVKEGWVGRAREAAVAAAGGRRRPAHSLISHEVDLSAAERNPRELIASNE